MHIIIVTKMLLKLFVILLAHLKKKKT